MEKISYFYDGSRSQKIENLQKGFIKLFILLEVERAGTRLLADVYNCWLERCYIQALQIMHNNSAAIEISNNLDSNSVGKLALQHIIRI